VDVRNLVKNKLYICRDWHIQPSEIDRLVYFEYEYILQDINKENQEQEKRNKEDEKKYGNMGKLPNYNNMMNSASHNMPKMPSFNMPKF
jgi:hypothetical protein